MFRIAQFLDLFEPKVLVDVIPRHLRMNIFSSTVEITNNFSAKLQMFVIKSEVLRFKTIHG